MIRSIQIERFKSIRELKIELGKVNIFIGGNGSGKSNILEAIGVVSAALGRGISESEFARKGVRITPPALMKSAFKNYDLPKSLKLTVDLDNDVQYYCALTASDQESLLSFSHEGCFFQKRKIFGRSPKGASAVGAKLTRSVDRYRGIWDQTRALSDYPDAVARELDELLSYAIYAPQTEFLRGMKVGKISSPPVGLHGEGLPTAVRTFLRDYPSHHRKKSTQTEAEASIIRRALGLVFEPGWAEQVRVGQIANILRSPDIAGEDMVYFIDRFLHSKRNTLSVYDSSEGTLFLLFAAILMAHVEAPRIFAMDNVDSALNPKITKSLLDCIIFVAKQRGGEQASRGPSQIFLTSHNPTALDAFDIFDGDTRVFVVSRKSETGETLAERLVPPEGMSRDDWRVASKGRNLSQMWIDGEITGALGGI